MFTLWHAVQECEILLKSDIFLREGILKLRGHIRVFRMRGGGAIFELLTRHEHKISNVLGAKSFDAMEGMFFPPETPSEFTADDKIWKVMCSMRPKLLSCAPNFNQPLADKIVFKLV